MPMDPETCDPVELARLARLGLDEEERALFQVQLRRMVEAFQQIGDLPTVGVEPFAQLRRLRQRMERTVGRFPSGPSG